MSCLRPVIRKSLFVGLVVALLLAIAFAAVPLPAQAGSKTNAWNKYPIPQQGETGDWVLTGGGTGVTAICAAFDGTIYAATEEISGSPLNGYDLFKSTDDGYSWTPLWKIPSGHDPAGDAKVIALILPQREDADILYLATQYNIYLSTDGGERFRSLSHPPLTSGATSDNSVQITSFDVADCDGTHLILAGTRDADDSDYGGAYFYDDSKPFTGWADLRVGGVAAGTGYDVLAVAFSPNFAEDEQFVAVITDETDTVITSKVGISNWGDTIGDAVVPGLAAIGGSLAFPDDYDSDVYEDKYTHFVGLNGGGVNGGIYMVTGAEVPDNSTALPVFAPAPVHSLAAAGNAAGVVIVAGETFGLNLVAGLTNGNVINFATGVAYTPPAASPAENACVALGELRGSYYVVYAGTSGDDGGFARSIDGGATFARTAFIGDDIATITDLAISPVYSKDDTMYMITEGSSGNEMLWRTNDHGKTWDAILTEGQQITNVDGDMKTIGAFDTVALSLRFKSDATVFIGESGNEPNIWRSTDNGSRFWALPTKPTTATIDSWAAAGMKKVLVGDSSGNFYKTTNGGLTWKKADEGLSGFSDMALSPEYSDDQTILAADSTGNVYLSTDEGDTWQELADTSFEGSTVVAFHPEYAENGVFFAAGKDASDDLVVERYGAEGEDWEEISPSGFTTGGATGIVVGTDGTLYVSDKTADGVFRTLNPTASDTADVEWENAAEDFTDDNISELFLTSGSNMLWGINGDDIWHYEDTLTGSVMLSSPGDGYSSGRVDSATLSWDKLEGAEEYQIEVNTDPGFKGKDHSPANTEMTSVRVTGLEDGQTYYWRVRVAEGEPAMSRYSTVWSVTTTLGVAQWNPFVGGVPEAPANGATNVPRMPSFAWNAADWATGYEFVLASDAVFKDVVISRTGSDALTASVYLSEQELDYSTTYYWKVRAISKTTSSEWAVGVFTTEPEMPAPPPSPPAPSAAPGTPDISGARISIWVMLATVVVLIVALLVLIMVTRHPR